MLAPQSQHAPNESTRYAIGNMTKLIAVYTFLVELGDCYWNDRVTKFIPELEVLSERSTADPINNVR